MSKRVLVAGLINVETTLRVESFPIPYAPIHYPFFGVHSTVSGVGYNLAKALATLGNEVVLLSLLGRDLAGRLVRETLASIGLLDAFLLTTLDQTPQSVILYEATGRRQIHTDLKDIQEQRYPETLFEEALADCSLCVLGNINFSRPLLERACAAGKLVATDVHALADLEDPYNQDYGLARKTQEASSPGI